VGERVSAVQDPDVYEDPAGRWVIRPYRSGDEAAILDLFRRVFGVDRSLEHWRWKFQENPAGRTIRLAQTPSGELVGQHAGLPVRVTWGDKTLVFTQIVDVMVDPRFRRGLKRPGLFSALVNRFIADCWGPWKVSAGYGFPTPEALRIGGRVAGYTPLHPVVGLVRELGGAGRQRPPWSARLFRIEEVDRYGEEIDRLWQRLRPELAVATVRDSRYLNWRYADCPDTHYQMLAAFHRLTGTPAGMAILRLWVRQEPVAALVDWLVPSRAVGLALVARCEEIARESGMNRLEAWFPPYSWTYRFFEELGFRASPTIYQITALPTSREVSLDWARERWYYTMGDSDIY
jgi:hypothetical protein